MKAFEDPKFYPCYTNPGHILKRENFYIHESYNVNKSQSYYDIALIYVEEGLKNPPIKILNESLAKIYLKEKAKVKVGGFGYRGDDEVNENYFEFVELKLGNPQLCKDRYNPLGYRDDVNLCVKSEIGKSTCR